MNRGSFVFFLLAVPAMCSAAAPTLIGRIELKAPLVALRTSSDGKRAVALLQGSSDKAAGLSVIDTSAPQAPIAKGFLPGVSGSLALAHDGRSALVVTQLEEEKFNTAIRHEIIAIDVSTPDQPKVTWRREIVARRVVLAPDATAYAASEPVRTKEGMWQTTVSWVSGDRQPLIVEESPNAPADMQLSAGGTFLATPSFGTQLRIVDLRSEEPIVYEQLYVFYQRYKCLAAVLRDGHVVIDDQRAPRLGVYAPMDDDVLRVGVLQHDGSEHCQQLEADPDGGSLMLAADWGRLSRVAVHQPSRPVLSGTWQLPLSTYPLAVAGNLLYAAGATQGRELQIFRLNITAASSVDWGALAAVHRAAMDHHNRELRERKPIPGFNARRQLEEAGVVQALDAPLASISRQQAAAILNDYGFLAWRGHPNLAERALRRAMDLDPNRALAALNLADGLRDHLPTWSDPATKPARVSEIQVLYRKYLALGGKTNARIEAFLKGAEDPHTESDICHAIARYANSGRLADLVSQSAINVPAGGYQLDLVFSYEGTAHVPAVHAFDSDSDMPFAVTVPGEESLWGDDNLGLVVYGEAAHILHYRDFRHPVASAEVGGEAGCTFTAKTIEKIGPAASEPELCRSLSQGKGPPSIQFEAPALVERESISQRYRETHAGNMRALDFANDGKPVPLVELNRTSSAGAGCEAHFYDVLDKGGRHLASGPKHEQLMKLQRGRSDRYPIRPCGNAPRFFSYRGKIFFENKPARWPPIDSSHQYHLVVRAAGGEVVDVCDFRFETTISVGP